MTVKPLIALGALSTIALASSAFAQAPAPAPAAAPPVVGPPVAGVCTYAREAALVNSTVGQSTVARLKQLGASIDAELTKEGGDLQAEQQALQAIPADQRQQPANVQQIQAFNKRAQDFENTRKLRGAELEATQNKQFGVIQSTYVAPILTSVATSKGCGLLLERSTLYWANPQMDITEAVVAQLNGKVQALPFFDRERIDPNTGNVIGSSAAAAAPRPAAAPAPATTTTKKKPH